MLLVGAGGVGATCAAIAARQDFLECRVVSDRDLARAGAAVDAMDDGRFAAAEVDASDSGSVARPAQEHGATQVTNTVDPRFVVPVLVGACTARADDLDTAMSQSRPHPDAPSSGCGVKLGHERFAAAGAWEQAGRLALVGTGVAPGPCDVLARYAADQLFSTNEELGVLRTLPALGPDRTDPVRVGGVEVSPRDVVAACLPDPAGLVEARSGTTCAGVQVTGPGPDGGPRSTYHVVDEAWSMTGCGHPCAVWQTAVNRWSRWSPSPGATGRGPASGAGGLRRGAVPDPAHRVRQSPGPARRRLSPTPGAGARVRFVLAVRVVVPVPGPPYRRRRTSQRRDARGPP